MISFRHHVVSLVAVFLALAVGVVLGGGPLSELGREDSGADSTNAPSTAADDVVRVAGFAGAFATTAAPALLAGGLKDRGVAVVTLPGADATQVKAVSAGITQAGGEVTGQYDLLPGLVAAGEKSLVDTLGSQLMTQIKDPAIAADAPTYERMGQLLGRSIAIGAVAGAAPDDNATAIRQSLSAADLLTVGTADAALAPLVLVVLGERTDPAVLTGLLAGLASRPGDAGGVVVAGPLELAAADGDLGVVRADALSEAVSTVDSLENGAGQVSAVLALVRELSATGGAFGAANDAGPVPLG